MRKQSRMLRVQTLPRMQEPGRQPVRKPLQNKDNTAKG